MKQRIGMLVFLAICSSLPGKVTRAASVADIALYRGADRQARLENGAKGEGQVTWYTSISLPDSQKIIELFEKRYPFVKVNLVRSNSATMVQRHTSELQAKRFTADILDTNDTRIEFLRRKATL